MRFEVRWCDDGVERQRGYQNCIGGTRDSDGIWVFSNIGMVFESLHAKIVVFESFTLNYFI